MANLETTVVTKLFAVELCSSPDCTCKREGDPDFVRLGETVHNGSMDTNLYFSRENAQEYQVPVNGVPRQKEIIEAFNDCPGPIRIDSGEIVCGAIAKLRGHS
jgi:hypothetical protein